MISKLSDALHQSETARFDSSSIVRGACLVLALFALHFLHILLLSAANLAIGSFGSFAEALDFSASVYGRLSLPDVGFPHEWLIFAALQSLISFLMIAWSIAFLIHTFRNARS